ncbi:MAG: sensor histidine kinase [Lachnospiraceae bacterium]|nr:sensor histidine kinase [Lachnospiraceae bacterium]
MEAVAFIGCLYKKNIISTWINKISFQRLFLFFVGFIEIAIVVYVINVDWERGYDINSLILLGALIVLLLLAVISLLLVWEYHAVIRTNHILKANESRMKVYYGLLSEEIHQKLKRNHDRRYEDEYVYNCLIREEYEKCLSYFQNKYIKDNVQAEITCTGYDMADYLIGRIVKQCAESDIKVTVEVEMRRSPIEENEFFVLLANLLDNAVEAASKCRTDRFIEIRIQEMSSMFRLYIVNSYAEEPMKDGGRLISGKNDGGNHGWGLESVKDTVKKYDGTIDILYENKRFVVDIVFMG